MGLSVGTGLLTTLTEGTGLLTTLPVGTGSLTEGLLTEETGFTRLKRGGNPVRRSRSVRTWMPCRLWKMTL